MKSSNSKKDVRMKSIILSKYKQMLWKDEIDDVFLLLKYAEVYPYSENVMRLHLFSKKMLLQLREMGVVLNEVPIDDDFYILDIEKKNLPLIIELGKFKRRPSKKGKWIKDKEKKLAHKIIPLR